jgi:hypothetical protein
MCTVSWVHVDGGYHLMSNRDERRTRLPAAPPVAHEVRGVRFLAPEDGDFGGTWISVNELGVALCLLNRYDFEAEPDRDYTSRGLLVRDLADSAGRLAVRERLGATALADYRPFTLVALAPGEPALVARWTGRTCLFEYDGEYTMPLVSSSFEADAVAAFRRELLLGPAGSPRSVTLEALDAFHRGHEPRPGPYSVCMHRDDAETASYSRVSVVGDQVEFAYTPGAPCGARSSETLTLRRTAGAVR